MDHERKEPAYSVVPYLGTNGTRRRPIFIECLADRIVLQPEGIELAAEDFEEPLTLWTIRRQHRCVPNASICRMPLQEKARQPTR